MKKRHCAIALQIFILLGRIGSNAGEQLLNVSHVGQLTAALLSKIKSGCPGEGAAFFGCDLLS